ncbi:MAG: LuxR C-terminal-related transcriptional regulator [Chloroflexota bacterium]
MQSSPALRPDRSQPDPKVELEESNPEGEPIEPRSTVTSEFPEFAGRANEEFSGRVREAALPYIARPALGPRLSFRLDAELSAWLRLAAQARDGSPRALAAELLARGLEQEARRARARSVLEILTPREREVARLTGRGQTNHQIAYALRIAPETVKSHVRNTLNKFGLHSKADLRLLLREVGNWEG